MDKTIKIPRKVTGVRFLNENSRKIKAGYTSKELFHQIAEEWYVRYEEQFKATRNPLFQGYLDPGNGQLIIGLDEIAQDYVSHQSLRNPRIGNDWGTGNSLGGLYVLTKEDVESRLGCNDVTIGEVNHPLEPGTLLSHRISKNDLMKVRDKAVCTRHSGDHFFDYQLLHEAAGDLVRVKGMDFGSYSLTGEPIGILKIEYTQQIRK